MNKVELANKIAEKIGLTKIQAEAAMDAFVSITIEELKRGGEVTLTGFGAFSARRRKGREGINPRNPSEKITIPSVIVAKFKAGKTLKDELKNSGQDSANPVSTSSEPPAEEKSESASE